MRKCLKSNVEMIENLELKIKEFGMKMAVSEKGTFLGSHPLAEIKLLVLKKKSNINLTKIVIGGLGLELDI